LDPLVGQVRGREDVVFFMRSGFLQSGQHSRLYWLGDQLTTWDGFDGLASVVTGMLSSGTVKIRYSGIQTVCRTEPFECQNSDTRLCVEVQREF
jgi:hypothetical protein